MGTYWTVYCPRCEESLELEDERYYVAEALLRGAKHIAALVPIDGGEDVYVQTNRNSHVSPKWFAKHEPHGLALRSEYGEVE